MIRKITEKLIEWKNNPHHKPLLIRGARQVGKSFSIMEFGKKYFEGDVHIINLERNPDLHVIFELNLDTNRIISELELVLNKKIRIGKDLLFFDEIQECPNAIKSLRYFYEQHQALHMIAAGSLLEFALQDISFPVGRLQMLNMYPLTFEEFLLAREKTLILEEIQQAGQELQPNIVSLVNTELYKYFIVGGMPECVANYIKTGSYIEVGNIQSDLMATFRQDFSKYSPHSDKRCLNSVLDSVSQKVGSQIKYAHLSQDFSNPTIKKAYELMETAHLFHSVKATSPAGLPFGASASQKKFKAVFLDIGLLAYMNGFSKKELFSKQKLFKAFSGIMAEQFVGQELLANSQDRLYYWSRDARNSSAEVDYLMEKDSEIIPIEVKSGKSGRLKSLHLLLESYDNIKRAHVFTEDKYGELPEQKLTFYPLFCVGFVS
ncbi:MAG: nuclease [Bacteroidetes bacterium 4572_77]|nr:MAG: nuclease [Bacteroidetes bacterium 4572_77]